MDLIEEQPFHISAEEKIALMGYCWRPRWFERNNPSKYIRQPLKEQRDASATNFLVELPVEIIRKIIECLDFRTIFRLRLVDVATHDFIDSLPQLNRLLEHASDPLKNLIDAPPNWKKMAYHREKAKYENNGFEYQSNIGWQIKDPLSTSAYQAISLLDYVTMGQLHDLLYFDRCARCSEYGPFLDIFGRVKQRFCYTCLFSLGLHRDYKLYGLSTISCDLWCIGMPTLRMSGEVENGIWCRGCEDVYLTHFINRGDDNRPRIQRESHRAFSVSEFQQHVLECSAAHELARQFKSQDRYNSIFDFLRWKHFLHKWEVRVDNPGFPIQSLPCSSK